MKTKIIYSAATGGSLLCPQIHHLNFSALVKAIMAGLHEQRRVSWVRVEAFQPTLPDIIQSVARRQTEEAIRLVLGRAHNRQRLWQHHLVRTMRVQVNAGQKRRLTGMSL